MAYKQVKITCGQSGDFTVQNNKFSIRLPESMGVISGSDCEMLLDTRLARATDPSTPLPSWGGHLYGYSHLKSGAYVMIRNARIESTRHGLIEEERYVNVRVKNLRYAYSNTSDVRNSIPFSEGDDRHEYSTLARQIRAGEVSDVQQKNAQRVKMNEVFGYFDQPVIDLKKTGDLTIHFELENDVSNIVPSFFTVYRPESLQKPKFCAVEDKTFATGNLNQIRILYDTSYFNQFNNSGLFYNELYFFTRRTNGAEPVTSLCSLSNMVANSDGTVTVTFNTDKQADTDVITQGRLYVLDFDATPAYNINGIDTTLAAPNLNELDVANADRASFQVGDQVYVSYTNGGNNVRVGCRIEAIGGNNSGTAPNSTLVEFNVWKGGFAADGDTLTNIVIKKPRGQSLAVNLASTDDIIDTPIEANTAGFTQAQVASFRFYLGQKVFVSYHYHTSGNAMTIYNDTKTVTDIEYNATGQKLTFDTAYAPAGRKLTYSAALGTEGVKSKVFIGSDDRPAIPLSVGTTNGAEFNAGAPYSGVDLTYNIRQPQLLITEIQQMNDMQRKALSMKRPFYRYLLEQVNQPVVNANMSYSKQLDIEPNVDMLMIVPQWLSSGSANNWVLDQTADPLIGRWDNVYSFRNDLNHEQMSDRDVFINQPYYRDMIESALNNPIRQVRNLNYYLSKVMPGNNADTKNEYMIVCTPIPMSPQPQHFQLNETQNGNNSQEKILYVFKRQTVMM